MTFSIKHRFRYRALNAGMLTRTSVNRVKGMARIICRLPTSVGNQGAHRILSWADAGHSSEAMATGSTQVQSGDVLAFLAGGGEMAALMRAKDWAASSLGPPAGWPECVKSAVSLCLNSQFAILLWLGPELRLAYNDACIPLLGDAKHPAALGAPGREVFGEVWHTIGPMHDEVQKGRSIHVEDFQFFFTRNRPREEVYVTFGYTPIREENDGAVQGTFGICVETTGAVIGARRLATLRDLGRRTTERRTIGAVCEAMAAIIDANPLDIPFAAIYLLDADGHNARRIAAIRLPQDSDVLPDILPMAAISTDSPAWPLHEAGRARNALEIDNLQTCIGRFHAPIWGCEIDTGVVLPLIQAHLQRPVGFLIAGVSPHRAFDADYRSFFEMAAGHISTAIADGHALEAEQGQAEAFSESGAAASSPSAVSKLPDEWLLNELTTRLRSMSDLRTGLQEVLQATMEVQNADFGEVRLFNEATQCLEIVAHSGLDEEFLRYFKQVDASDASASGLALTAGERVVIEDVNTNPAYEPHRQIAARAGCRAVQSTPLFDREGNKPLGMLSTLFRNPRRLSERELRLTDLYARQAADVIAFKISEQRLRESRARLQAAAGLIGLCSYSWDLQTNAVECDAGLRSIWGLSPDAPVDYDAFIRGVHPDDRLRVEAAIAASVDPAGEGLYDIEYRVIRASDGSERWIATRGQTTFENGNPVAFFGVALDITNRKRADQAREVLISELQHRTRNLLAVVSSIAAETMASSHSIHEFGLAFNDRLSSLSRVQGLLSRGEDNVATISGLVHLELRALGAEPDGERIVVQGPEVHLPSKSVQILALALHELATNARKYGALAVPDGQLSVVWVVLAEGRNRMLEIEWHETGLARQRKQSDAPHIGFGRTLIEESLPFQLDAQTKLTIDQNEVHCTITLALADQMAPTHG